MTIVFNKTSIEKHEFQRFEKMFKSGKFGAQRYGQAFYDHFNLHKVADQRALKNLYAKDGEHAKNLIKELFEIH